MSLNLFKLLRQLSSVPNDVDISLSYAELGMSECWGVTLSVFIETHLHCTNLTEKQDTAEPTVPLCGGLGFKLTYFYIPSALPGLAQEGFRSMLSE